MQDFKKLDVYMEAKKLALDIYKITSCFPKVETFAITSQIRRAAISVGANIAEGAGRISNPDFLRFLHNSMGSLKETEHFLIVPRELNYITASQFEELNLQRDKVAKMLSSLMSKIS